MEVVVVPYEQLKTLCANQFIRVGIPENHAHLVADVLVHADLRGVYSHGVMRTKHYIKRITSGGINPHPRFKIEAKTPAVSLFDGDDGLGHVVAKEAMQKAIELAQSQGIGLVGVMNSSHCGAMSYYVQLAADQKMIGMALTHTDKMMVPFGGAKPYFGTNPLAFGIPAQKHQPIILDMATTEGAYGKVLHAQKHGLSIPDNWGVDEEGRPTTDPHQVRGLLPFAGPKGYGLALIIDVLSGILTGSAFGPHITAMYGDYEKRRKLGHFMLAIDPSLFIPRETFLAKVDQMIDELHQVPPAPGFEKVMVPGEPEQIKAEARLKEGIPIPVDVYQELSD